MKEGFKQTGYFVDRTVFSSRECGEILRGIRAEDYLPVSTWYKGCAVSIPSWANLARNDRIVDTVSELLGDDVVLWGANLVERSPKQVHQWHNDLESCGNDGFVSVWMGIENTNPSTSLKVVPGSHLSPKLLLQFACDEGLSKQAINDGLILRWSNSYQEGSHIDFLDTRDGDILFFDGRLWHGSNNQSHLKKRVAVLLQYARADVPIRIPQFKHDRWPVGHYQSPKPPCLIVRGSSQGNNNHIMPGPPANPFDSNKAITTAIEHMELRPGEPGENGFQSFSLIAGPSPDLRFMSCHYSTLAPGKSPHPPHVHDDEEILIVVSGQVELVVEDAKGSNQLEPLRAEAGDFIYYPGNWRHTIKNISDQPVVYLMFKWLTDEYESDQTLERTLVKASKALAREENTQTDWNTNVVLEGKTALLRKLHSHITRMAPGRGYPAHADAYDVGIVLFEGQVETLGETVTAPAIIYYAAGEMHGMKCTGDATAKYTVFEFHGKHGDVYEHPKFRRRRKIKESLTNPGLLFSHLKWMIKHKLGK